MCCTFDMLAVLSWTQHCLGGLTHLEMFTWQNVTVVDRVTLPGRPGNPPRRVTPPVCKHDQIKMRDYCIWRSRLPLLGGLPHLPGFPCKQALRSYVTVQFLVCKSLKIPDTK